MSKNTNIFEKLKEISQLYGLDGIQGLAKELGYKSPEKLYRLDRVANARPSYDIILDIANKFEKINLRWFITGEGTIQNSVEESSMVSEEPVTYNTTEKGLLSLLAAEVAAHLEPKFVAQDEKINKLQESLHKAELIEQMKILKEELSTQKQKS